MARPLRNPGLRPAAGAPADRPATATEGAPRWVKVAGVVALLAALLLGAVLLFGGGQHGPARHAAVGGGGSAPSGVAGTQDAAEPSASEGSHGQRGRG